MPTAFSATWGEGDPVIGLLGEYDAMPSLSQKLSSRQEPVEVSGHGHGCGHNLFGTACLAAALALNRLYLLVISLEPSNFWLPCQGNPDR
jgi:aminobenzoyl-glutamate utilization protein B